MNETVFDASIRNFMTTCVRITPLEASNFKNYLLSGPEKTRKETVMGLETFVESASQLIPKMKAISIPSRMMRKRSVSTTACPMPGD
jgi:hypothetical protein